MVKLIENIYLQIIKTYNKFGGIKMEKLLEILSDIKPGVDFTKSNSIVDDGLLSSMDIARLVGEIGDEFDIDIEVTDLVPENFNSVNAIMKMIERLEEE